MNAKLIEQVKKATEIAGWIRECRSDTDIQYLNWCSAIGRLTCQHLPVILALLESCGDATPEQVRAALALAKRMAFMWGPDKPMIVRKDCLGSDAVKMIDEYRAAVAQKGGEDE